MDVDGELDHSLLQQFSCLGTTDRDVLIAEFAKLVGDQLNSTGCAFYLDMNNWNLQAAVCAYYDLEAPKERLPKLKFVRDVTVGEGESVPPNTRFIKTWRLQNPGVEPWPPGCSLKFVDGHSMSEVDRVIVEALPPGQATDVSVDMASPQKSGIYQGQWRLCTPTGCFFGELIWVIVTVAEGGTLGLTQQLSQLNELGAPVQNENPNLNPFAPKLDAPIHCNTLIATSNNTNFVAPGTTPSLTITSLSYDGVYSEMTDSSTMNTTTEDMMLQ